LTFQTVFICTGQKDSASGLKFNGYVDAYYSHYTDSVGHGKFQKFGYVSPVSDEFSINIAQLSAQYTSKIVRSTLTIQYGDIPQAVWSSKFNYIQEGYAGVKLCKKLWVDAGFFKSHIGTESLLPKDNTCSSEAVISWAEPFYQSGVRLTYTPFDKFTAVLYIVNGFNQFVANNKKKAAGLALTYNFSDNFNINYYNLLSDNTPDSINISHWRFWNNLVLNLILSKKVNAQFGADFITQQNSDIIFTHADINYSTALAFGSIVTFKYQCYKKFGIYARYETLYDPQGIITSSDNYYTDNNDFKLIGLTLGMEYKPLSNSYIRLEGRELDMVGKDEDIYYTNGNYVSTREEIMINMGVSF
jgi:Putative beta-barrel porin-2, OmpL-like. bbp2